MLQSILVLLKKIAWLQSLEVTCSYTWKNDIGWALFLLISNLQPKTIYTCLNR